MKVIFTIYWSMQMRKTVIIFIIMHFDFKTKTKHLFELIQTHPHYLASVFSYFSFFLVKPVVNEMHTKLFNVQINAKE